MAVNERLKSQLFVGIDSEHGDRCWLAFHLSHFQSRLSGSSSGIAEPHAQASIYVTSSHAFYPLRMSAVLLLFTKLKIVPAFKFPTLQSL